jgi:hypothetical protein
MAPTLGKFYIKASRGENYGMWGNFNVGYVRNELAHVDRGLYGAKAHYGSEAATSFGERRMTLDGFAAEPGTTPSYEEFRGTGGSLYYLRHQDILTGSERVRVEIRDKDSRIVTGVVDLRPSLDYDIDYLQGRLLLSEPLSSTAADNLQEQGERTDAVAHLMFDPGASWRAYGFVQNTVAARGGREDNGRVGAGGSYRPTKRFKIDAEVSDGDLGSGGRLGTTFLYSEQTNLYMNYSLENERTDNGQRVRRGNVISGAKRRLSDSSSVYMEERYQGGGSLTGLTHATGINLVAKERWNFGASTELGTLRDSLSGAATNRKATGIRLGYGVDKTQLSSAIEYRRDLAEQLDTTHTKRTAWLFRNNFKFQLTPDWRLLGKLNHSVSVSSLGEFYDGGYTEAVAGYAYRPVCHDRLSVLAKYTYFFNVPTTDQVTLQNTAAEFIQKSHIAALDLTYDVTADWSIGGKYAYRMGQASLDRVQRNFFDNTAKLVVLRLDRRFLRGWESLAEVRTLDLPDVSQHRRGALVAIYRYIGKNLKVGTGYNFTDFSDDLTDLRYDHKGVFVNLIVTK